MAASPKPEPGTDVARSEQPKRMLDVENAKVSRRFLDAYTTGKLDRLSAEEQSMFLFALGAKLGVRPELGELMLYQGKPYITIDGRVRLAHESGLLAGMDVRPATSNERRDYGAEADDALWVCLAYRRGAARSFKGWGHVTKADKNPVARQFPREMAKKRAKYDALRLTFPPAEYVSELHERYIEEAEAEIRAQQPVAHRLTTGGYEEQVEETGADGDVRASDGVQDEQPVGDVAGDTSVDSRTSAAPASLEEGTPARSPHMVTSDDANNSLFDERDVTPKARARNAIAEGR